MIKKHTEVFDSVTPTCS